MIASMSKNAVRAKNQDLGCLNTIDKAYIVRIIMRMYMRYLIW
jgi:hypothetical protein